MRYNLSDRFEFLTRRISADRLWIPAFRTSRISSWAVVTLSTSPHKEAIIIAIPFLGVQGKLHITTYQLEIYHIHVSE